MTMADQIVVMNDGRVEQIGTPLELYDRPTNIFVATFIGSPSMNLIKGTVVDNAATKSVRVADGTLLPVMTGASEGHKVYYGFRPEHLALCASDDGIAAQVGVVEPMGSETQVHLTIGGESAIGGFRKRISSQPGQIIRVIPDASKINLFDQSSGAAI